MAETETKQGVKNDTQGDTQGIKNQKIGSVLASKMAKTIVVEVTRRVPHPMYKRIVVKRKKFYAHDEQETAKVGDVVKIIECRPMSKLKRWTLGEVVRRAVQVTTDLSSIGIETGPEKRVSKKKGKKK
jgi:small subunit ribosomal protein S17